MSKHSDSQNISESSQDESEVILMLKKMQQHLSFLEKKIDLLVEGSSQGSSQGSYRDKRFSRPRSGGYSNGGYRGGQSEGGSGGYRGRGQSEGGYSSRRGSSSEGNSYSGDRSYGRSSSYERPRRGGQDQGQGFGDRKKRSFRPKKDSR